MKHAPSLRRSLFFYEGGPYNLRYCGNGSVSACRASLWSAFDSVVQSLASTYGPNPNTPTRR